MFIGHFGVAFGTKKATPALSLGLLFIAVQFLDLLWPNLLLLHVEHVAIVPGITKMAPFDFTDYPISHSLLMAIVWGLLFGGILWLIRRNIKEAVVLGLCVVSHWLLDLFVHRPDLPLFPGNSPKFGFGLWNYPYIEPIIELSIFFVGLLFYIQKTAPKNAIGNIGLWVLVLFLLLIQFSDLFTPPPTDVIAMAWSAQVMWILVLLAFWVDRNRKVRVLAV
jgi:hypothetical protein